MTPATICFPFVGEVVGGSHISAAGLIARLDQERFKPLVLLQHAAGPIADLFTETGIPHALAPATPELEHGRPVRAANMVRLAATAPRLARFLRDRRVAIVHCNDGRTLATWALATRLAKAKLLWHHRGAPDAAGLRLLAPLLADRVVAVSRFAAPKPGWYSAAPRTTVIHSPFDNSVEVDRDAARQTVLDLLPGADANTRIVAFCGALIERKRPLLFVEAIAAMRRRAPGIDVRGVLLGESFGGILEQVRACAARLGIARHIHALGYRTPGPFWLAGCDILLVPAIGEPFGRTLIEAMLVGTPVIATASGGNVEAIRDGQTGVLVPPENGEALGAACLDLLADSERREQIATAAREDARARYGEARHAEAVMALYAAMLAPQSPESPKLQTDAVRREQLS